MSCVKLCETCSGGPSRASSGWRGGGGACERRLLHLQPTMIIDIGLHFSWTWGRDGEGGGRGGEGGREEEGGREG